MYDLKDVVLNTGYELLRRASTRLPQDVATALSQAYQKETTTTGRTQLRAILDNIDLAEKHNTCVCQDTGIPLFFVRLGLKSGVSIDMSKPLVSATKKATRDVPLRPNVINPLTNENPGTNVGWNMPYIYYDVEPESDYVEITAMPKGFGSEAKSTLVFIATSEPMSEAIMRCVIDNTLMALGEPCPPTIVGLGIGGTGDIAMRMTKKAILRSPIGSPNTDPIVARLEQRILDALNHTGIGPMGMGGDITSLAVHAEMCGAHTAVVPLGISYQCWAARYSTARIYPNGEVRYLTHPEAGVFVPP